MRELKLLIACILVLLILAGATITSSQALTGDNLGLFLPFVAKSPPATATPTNGAARYAIYDDALAAGWQSWSWNTTVDFAASSPVHLGSKSAAFTYTAAWAGLYLHTEGIDTSHYQKLVFYLNGGASSAQQIRVVLYDQAKPDPKPISNGRMVNDYIEGGSIAANAWRVVSIPLADLGGANRVITGIVLQESAGGAQSRMFLDDMALVPANSQTPAGTPSPTSTAVPSATPVSITPTSSVGACSRFGVNLAGAEFGASFPGTYGVDYIYPTTAELDYFKSKGLMLIRLPFSWERVQRTLYQPLDGPEMERLDAFVDQARTNGMQVVLDPHNYARYHGNLVGTDAVPNSAFADFWHRLANHYKDDAAIYAYGLMNEPHDTGGRWPAAAQAAIYAIREVDTTHTILVPGDGYSASWFWTRDNDSLKSIHDPASNYMFEAHVYFDANTSGAYEGTYDSMGAYPEIGVDRAMPFVNWLRVNGKRGFFGEYGIPDDDARWFIVLNNFLSYLSANDVGGTYWAAGHWWGSYRLSVEPLNGQDRPQLPTLMKYPGNCPTS